jgi:predicted transcriptional regulator
LPFLIQNTVVAASEYCFFTTHKSLILNSVLTVDGLRMVSKLEMYVDILNVLEQRGPLKVSHIMHEANVNCSTLKGCLEFLIKQGLIEERIVGKNGVVYGNTTRGTQVIKFFTEMDRTLSVREVDDKILPVPC